ncbi:flavodoxin family protein [Croceicoccus sp. F390]|uniref:Flavodoxin family protein n=1 Tax=Croceicoccus esteveae TaxID=3075597 RepID=A0ABU2ZFV1_9SPHN|nr:flavodoxin family protein [Croceicoccus sp. F390]MDT0575458.1 flavodoxin family protein [Croceicoccus sp. F390]
MNKMASTAGTSLLIVWHSRTGASHQMAAAAAAAGGHGTCLLPAHEAQPRHVLGAAALLFACPENLATMSGIMKEFFDRCYYPVLGRIEGRAYATMVAAGSDGTGATRQIDRIATGWRLKRIAEPVIINCDAQDAGAILARKELDDDQLDPCRELGAAMAEGVRLGIF